MSLRQDLQSREFIITAELNPPKSSDPSRVLANAAKLKSLVSAINLTDNSAAAMKMCPLALGYLIQQQHKLEVVWQLTCRDRNRLGLQSDLLGGAALGLKNLLLLKGDAPQASTTLSEVKCFDLSTEELLKAVNDLKQGQDYDGNKLETSNLDYCVGAAAHPALVDLKAQRETMLRRMDLGVEFFQTQICFDIEQIERFVTSIGDELASRSLLGLTPLKSLKQAQFIDKNIFGVKVPEKLMQAMNVEEGLQQAQGLALAKQLVKIIKDTPLKGIHLMAIGQEDNLDNVIKGIL
jgi:methylenetetrahydrofolate reductase (NADPH)